jgi:hypothetical protein
MFRFSQNLAHNTRNDKNSKKVSSDYLRIYCNKTKFRNLYIVWFGGMDDNKHKSVTLRERLILFSFAYGVDQTPCQIQNPG